MPDLKNSDFPCPCGRKQRNECFGECAKEGQCVVCADPLLGHINEVPFCVRHVNEVMARVMMPAKILLSQLLGRG